MQAARDSEAGEAEPLVHDTKRLSFLETMRILDKYMPLHLQILGVIINAFAIIYQGTFRI